MLKMECEKKCESQGPLPLNPFSYIVDTLFEFIKNIVIVFFKIIMLNISVAILLVLFGYICFSTSYYHSKKVSKTKKNSYNIIVFGDERSFFV